MPLKHWILRIADALNAPVTAVSAWHLGLLRRVGLGRLPLSRRVLHRIGVLPVRRHFYEPLFHPDDLDCGDEAPRELPGLDFNTSGQRRWLEQFQFAQEIDALFGNGVPREFHGRKLVADNGAFGPGDIDYYYSLIRLLRPRRIVEVGAGYSTMVALCAVEANRSATPTTPCQVMAIEPYPWFQDERVTLIRAPFERLPADFFRQLHANDILFIDSSHVIRPRGDVIRAVLEVLPTLAPGVVVHVHDIFTPGDYPRRWITEEHILWNEQYLLEAFLTGNRDFEVIGGLAWLQRHEPERLFEKCPTLRQASAPRPSSFWIRRRPAAAAPTADGEPRWPARTGPGA